MVTNIKLNLYGFKCKQTCTYIINKYLVNKKMTIKLN